MKRLETLAGHFITTAFAEDTPKDVHICDRHLNIAKNSLSPDDFAHFTKQFIDYRAIPFPQLNPIPIIVKQSGKDITLANYRYPCKGRRKGIVYFVHGYSEYVGRYGYLAKYFSEAGYDFVGIDQRGFGYSQGIRGYIESEEIHIQDILAHIDKVDEVYGGKDVPKFIMGYSFGGLKSAKINTIRPGYFKGLALLAPYFGFSSKNSDKVAILAKQVAETDPTQKFPTPPIKPLPPDHVMHFILDPITEGVQICANNVWELNQAPKRLTQEMIQKIQTPVIMILGGKEQVVQNKFAMDFFNSCPAKDKQMLYFEDQDHFIFHETSQAKLVAENVIEFFNKQL
ncbi:hypothetical protein FGO68_gene15358 [Halteria grandinella]|uniref:Serine aminopeptidase S33 domain-containing protein n=1 Tax=Halteria grandinella TaxID=5974 RepID=A0A8J8T0F7_HALGN|nr:hypothetical protein FGO68_gene15358 [Halteria grandinella]